MKEENKIAITDILKQYPDIAIGYAFGSFGRGAESALSDVDVALAFGEDVAREKILDIVFHVGKDLEDKFRKRADVIVLSLPIEHPVLAHKIIYEGTPLIVKDKNLKSLFEVLSTREYEETKFLRETANSIIIDKIKNYVSS